MNVSSNFFNNLIETCKTEHLIREDGKVLSLGLLERLKTPSYSEYSTQYVHFKAVCRNLNTHEFEALPLHSQISSILSRIQHIRDQSFSAVEIGDVIDRFIEKGGQRMKEKMTKQELEATWKELAANLNEAERNFNVKQFEYTFKQIDALMDYTFQQKDSNLIKINVDNWNALYKQLTEGKPYNRYVEEKNEEYASLYNIGRDRGLSNYFH